MNKTIFCGHARRNALAQLIRVMSLAAVTINAKPLHADSNSRTDRHSDSDNYPSVIAGTKLSFPRDHGAHPEFRIEWWYLTAWLQSNSGPLGLQLTFFRSRTPYGRNNPSRFAPRQLIFAHAAIADPEHGSLLHAEQAWRIDPVTASYKETDTGIFTGSPAQRWSLRRSADDHYHASVRDGVFDFDIVAVPDSKPILQGDAGFSPKGPEAAQASYYYSRPQLSVSGYIKLNKQKLSVYGKAWLDHEWSSELLDSRATGWDWVGLNFTNGDALMAFRMRTHNDDVLHSTARLIKANNVSSKQTRSKTEQQTQDYPVVFSVLRHWQSPRTGAIYPVAMRLRAGELDLTLEPLIDDQELDSRGSTGIIYWEGAVRAWLTTDIDDTNNGNRPTIATGYLELTGYAGDVLF
ncbi:MAG: lipocalin-like domain-containing protein [Granulosicoccus sp.]